MYILRQLIIEQIYWPNVSVKALGDYNNLLKYINNIGDPANVYSERQAILNKLAEKNRSISLTNLATQSIDEAKADKEQPQLQP